MKAKFSSSWKSSKNPRKQRKYIANAPKHIKRKLLSCMLSRELRKKYGKRSIPIKTGDRVKILRGQFKKASGNVMSVNLKKSKVYVESAQLIKKDGTKTFYPISPSNLAILELNLEDRLRKKIIERIKNGTPQKA